MMSCATLTSSGEFASAKFGLFCLMSWMFQSQVQEQSLVTTLWSASPSQPSSMTPAWTTRHTHSWLRITSVLLTTIQKIQVLYALLRNDYFLKLLTAVQGEWVAFVVVVQCIVELQQVVLGLNPCKDFDNEIKPDDFYSHNLFTKKLN